MRNNLIIREKNTIPQKTLDYASRINNLKKAFKIVAKFGSRGWFFREIQNSKRGNLFFLAKIKAPELRAFTYPNLTCQTVIKTLIGFGFPLQILAHAFEPYVTTKAKGTGLGLAIVKKIVADHGGVIHLSNRESGGAEVSIELLLAEKLAA